MAKNVSNLDLDGIKQNLKNFLKNQEEFKDFNFEGSAISVLLDLLSYFIQYIGFYTNATFNELFLETAQIRKNVVTIAKSLGYFPRRKVASRISGTISFSGNENISIPSETKFVGYNSDGEDFVFETREVINLTSDNNYTSNIELYQQETVEYTTIYNGEKITLPYGNEIETLFVYVNGNLWNFYDFKINLTSESEVYFLEEDSETGKLVISFGNNLFGKQPEEGSEITIKMYITQGAKGNNVGEIELAELIYDENNIAHDKSEFILSFGELSSGGQDEESVQSIKLNASRIYETQNRLVTKRDYKDFLSTFDFVEAYSVWGGEEFVPPVYGTIFLSIKPTTGKFLSFEQRNEILESISEKQIVSLRVEFLDPIFIDLDINITVWYYKNQGIDTGNLENEIKQVIRNYFQENDIYFYSILKYSKLIDLITDIEGVSHCEIDLITYTILEETPNNSYSFKLFNEIIPGSVYSNDFTDDNNGNLILKSNGTKIGSVDYINGEIKFSLELTNTPYRVYYIFKKKDIAIKFNVLLNLDNINVVLNPF